MTQDRLRQTTARAYTLTQDRLQQGHRMYAMTQDRLRQTTAWAYAMTQDRLRQTQTTAQGVHNDTG